MTALSERAERVRRVYDDAAATRPKWQEKNHYFYESDYEYMRYLVPEGARVLELGCSTGELLAALKPAYGVGIDFAPKMVEHARARHPDLTFICADIEREDTMAALEGPFDYVILSDTIGVVDDVLQTLRCIRSVIDRDTRVVVAYYSHYWEAPLRLAEKLGLKMAVPEMNFLPPADMRNILSLANFEPVDTEWRILSPFRLFGIGSAINATIALLPLIRRACLRNYIVARPLVGPYESGLSATVLVPCRNERGNIENAVKRLPQFAPDIEVIYIEGNSSDNTFEECQRVAEAYASKFDIKVLQQEGKGKGNAVWKGFDHARGDIVMILDADLTVPPEQLGQFYDAIQSGRGEFVMGTRLVYPMEAGAMRFLNWWGNRFFAGVFSFILNQRFTDTLCGTKVILRRHYKILSANRAYFGDFDPFGDFDLIFGAAKMNLKLVEVPVRYRAREYGEPQISRFRDGFLLLRMVAFAWRKMKMLA